MDSESRDQNCGTPAPGQSCSSIALSLKVPSSPHSVRLLNGIALGAFVGTALSLLSNPAAPNRWMALLAALPLIILGSLATSLLVFLAMRSSPWKVWWASGALMGCFNALILGYAVSWRRFFSEMEPGSQIIMLAIPAFIAVITFMLFDFTLAWLGKSEVGLRSHVYLWLIVPITLLLFLIRWLFLPFLSEDLVNIVMMVLFGGLAGVFSNLSVRAEVRRRKNLSPQR